MMNKHVKRRIHVWILTCITLCTLQVSKAQSGTDSITHIECPGADTIMAGMVVSNNGTIHYTTNRETGIYNMVSKSKSGNAIAHSKLFKDENNKIWVLQGTTVIKSNENGIRVEKYEIPASYCQGNHFRIRNMVVDKRGNVWISSNNGLLVKSRSGWQHFTAANSSISSNNVKSIVIGPGNSKWILTDSSICVLGDTVCSDCSQWTNLDYRLAKFPTGMAKCVTFNKNGDAFIGTYIGLILKYSNGKLDTLSVCKPNNINTFISALAFDKFGNLWAGTWGLGLLKINVSGTSAITYNSTNSIITNNYINEIYCNIDNVLCVGTGGAGIYKIKPTKDGVANASESESLNKKPVLNTNQVRIFPNPSSGMFMLSAQYPDVFSLSISDIYGKTIKSFSNFSIGQGTALDLSTLSAGMYFLNISIHNTTATTKITIQK